MTATLALFCGAKSELIERLLKNARHEGLIVACKAAKLTWPTVALILQARFSHHSVSHQELDTARNAFIELSQAAAQRVDAIYASSTRRQKGRLAVLIFFLQERYIW